MKHYQQHTVKIINNNHTTLRIFLDSVTLPLSLQEETTYTSSPSQTLSRKYSSCVEPSLIWQRLSTISVLIPDVYLVPGDVIVTSGSFHFVNGSEKFLTDEMCSALMIAIDAINNFWKGIRCYVFLFLDNFVKYHVK